MRYIIETGTDGATLCFFNPAALPADFDENGGSSRLRAFVVKPAPGQLQEGARPQPDSFRGHADRLLLRIGGSLADPALEAVGEIPYLGGNCFLQAVSSGHRLCAPADSDD